MGSKPSCDRADRTGSPTRELFFPAFLASAVTPYAQVTTIEVHVGDLVIPLVRNKIHITLRGPSREPLLRWTGAPWNVYKRMGETPGESFAKFFESCGVSCVEVSSMEVMYEIPVPREYISDLDGQLGNARVVGLLDSTGKAKSKLLKEDSGSTWTFGLLQDEPDDYIISLETTLPISH